MFDVKFTQKPMDFSYRSVKPISSQNATIETTSLRSDPQLITKESYDKAENLIQEILKKRNLDKVPESGDVQPRKSTINIDTLGISLPERREINPLKLSAIEKDSSRSPNLANLNYLSPLLSSADLNSKNNTLLYSQYLNNDIRTSEFTTPERKFEFGLLRDRPGEKIQEIKEEASTDLITSKSIN